MTLSDRARKVKPGDHKRAAEVYHHALGTSAQVLDKRPPPKAELDDADRAQQILEDAFGEDIKQVAHVGPKKWAAQARKNDRPPRERRPARAATRRPSTRRQAAPTSRTIARGVRRGFRDTGIPQGTRSATRTALNFAGAGFGLSILYLLLTNAEHARSGKSAVELFSQGLGRTAQVLVSPAVDPLSPNNTASSAASGATAAVDAAFAAAGPPGPSNIPGITPLLPAVVGPQVLAPSPRQVPRLPAHKLRIPAPKVRIPAHPNRPNAAGSPGLGAALADLGLRAGNLSPSGGAPAPVP